jgi:hypothetical protein
MATILDISDWNHKPYISTGGTRSKTYVEAPDGTLHFFKTSLNKPGKNYIFEFWSEILAFEIGQSLGFNVLRYDVAIDQNQVGCISKSMIDTDKEVLNEGIRYLKAYDSTFNFDNKESRSRYSFQVIEESLQMFGLQRFLPDIIGTIIFDSIIGNGDRHQENWATISLHTAVTEPLPTPDTNRFWQRLQLWFRQNRSTPTQIREELDMFRLIWNRNVRFAPIYDSGSSLARECTEEKIQRMLLNKAEFEGFIQRGQAEIRWYDKKLKHFDLITQLKSLYRVEIESILERTLNRRNLAIIESLVLNTDKELPVEQEIVRLSDERKELIYKLLLNRLQRLEILL